MCEKLPRQSGWAQVAVGRMAAFTVFHLRRRWRTSVLHSALEKIGLQQSCRSFAKDECKRSTGARRMLTSFCCSSVGVYGRGEASLRGSSIAARMKRSFLGFPSRKTLQLIRLFALTLTAVSLTRPELQALWLTSRPWCSQQRAKVAGVTRALTLDPS